MPLDMKTPCDLAGNVYAADRPLRFGLPLLERAAGTQPVAGGFFRQPRCRRRCSPCPRDSTTVRCLPRFSERSARRQDQPDQASFRRQPRHGVLCVPPGGTRRVATPPSGRRRSWVAGRCVCPWISCRTRCLEQIWRITVSSSTSMMSAAFIAVISPLRRPVVGGDTAPFCQRVCAQHQPLKTADCGICGARAGRSTSRQCTTGRRASAARALARHVGDMAVAQQCRPALTHQASSHQEVPVAALISTLHTTCGGLRRVSPYTACQFGVIIVADPGVRTDRRG